MGLCVGHYSFRSNMGNMVPALLTINAISAGPGIESFSFKLRMNASCNVSCMYHECITDVPCI